MDRNTLVRVALAALAFIAMAGGVPALAAPPSPQDLPLNLTAVAVDMGQSGRAAMTRVDITIDRWSTDAERDGLRAALIQQGSDALIRALQSIKPRVGHIRTPTSLAWDLLYAHRHIMPDGSYRLIIASDRPIRFYEAANATRSSDYDFLFVELRMTGAGTGEGKLIPRAKITYDKATKAIEVEDYSAEPVMLKDVKVEARKK